jgi:hypothetical protein
MAETCIVCLGEFDSVTRSPSADIALNDSDSPVDLGHLTARPKQPLEVKTASGKSSAFDNELIARLPCGHYMHDDCIRPWVERANSCPTCRATFEVVELIEKIGGIVTIQLSTSY